MFSMHNFILLIFLFLEEINSCSLAKNNYYEFSFQVTSLQGTRTKDYCCGVSCSHNRLRSQECSIVTSINDQVPNNSSPG